MQIDDKLLADLKEWLRVYIEDNCIYRVAPGESLLPTRSGVPEYIWQFYPRRGLFNAKFMNAVGILFWHKFAPLYHKRPFQIAGLETGATPLVCALTMTSHLFGIDVNALSIRKDRKYYGLRNRFEGIIDYTLPVVLVDDLCNSKNTIAWSKYHCEVEGLKIYNRAFVVINKNIHGASALYDKYIGPDIKMESIFTIGELHMDWHAYQFMCKMKGIQPAIWRRENLLEDPMVLDPEGMVPEEGIK